MIETFFTEKRIIKKLILAIVFVFMFNFTFCYLGSNVVFAAQEVEEGADLTEDKIQSEEGTGKLLLPIQRLILFLCDSIITLFQDNFIGGRRCYIRS